VRQKTIMQGDFLKAIGDAAAVELVLELTISIVIELVV
jgi:hypothetical protein